MKADEREQIASSLEAAAKAIRQGDDSKVTWYTRTPDGTDYHSFQDVYESFHQWLEPDGEWHPEMSDLEWGIRIPIETAVEEIIQETPDREYDYESAWHMVPVWTSVEALDEGPKDANRDRDKTYEAFKRRSAELQGKAYTHPSAENVELALKHLAFVTLEMKEVSKKLAAVAREGEVIPEVLEYIQDSMAECHRAGEALAQFQDKIKGSKWEPLSWTDRLHRDPRRYLDGMETVQGSVLPPSQQEVQSAYELRSAGEITLEEFQERTRVQRSPEHLRNRYSESPGLPFAPMVTLPPRPDSWGSPPSLGCGLCGRLTCRGECFK